MLFLPGISGGGTLILIQYAVSCRYGVLKREKTQEDMDMKKRIVSLLMAVLMLVTMLPVTAMAEELTTTDPTEEQVVSGETTPDPAEEPGDAGRAGTTRSTRRAGGTHSAYGSTGTRAAV